MRKGFHITIMNPNQQTIQQLLTRENDTYIVLDLTNNKFEHIFSNFDEYYDLYLKNNGTNIQSKVIYVEETSPDQFKAIDKYNGNEDLYEWIKMKSF